MDIWRMYRWRLRDREKEKVTRICCCVTVIEISSVYLRHSYLIKSLPLSLYLSLSHSLSSSLSLSLSLFLSPLSLCLSLTHPLSPLSPSLFTTPLTPSFYYSTSSSSSSVCSDNRSVVEDSSLRRIDRRTVSKNIRMC